jgi:hypothetical protein
VKPGIGSIADWKRHEQRNNYLKNNIGGSFLLKKKNNRKKFGDLGLSFGEQGS